MASNAPVTAVGGEAAGPLSWPAVPPTIFQGDGEEMVELLVDACVRANEVHRAAVARDGSKTPPRAGRELVPYFMPGTTEWGLDDVNVNTDDSDGSEGSVRGYESGSSLGSTHSGRALAEQGGAEGARLARSVAEKVCSAAKSSGSKSSRRRNKKDKARAGVAQVPTPPQPSPALSRNPKAPTFAGTTFGLASPEPDSLPVPSVKLLSHSLTTHERSAVLPRVPPSNNAMAAEATSVLRGLLQLEATSNAVQGAHAVISAEAHLKRMLQVASPMRQAVLV